MIYRFVLSLTFIVILIFSCTDKRYPCPAYNNRTQARFDSSGNAISNKKMGRDRKTGLIVKKKNKNLLDRKNNQAKIF